MNKNEDILIENFELATFFKLKKYIILILDTIKQELVVLKK
jgi:hypothetical protein